MMKAKGNRYVRFFVALAVVLMWVTGALAQEAAQPTDVRVNEWFILKANAAANWNVETDPDNPRQFTLTPKTPLETDIPAKRVLALFTKQSSSYDTAIDRILQIFLSKQIPVTLTALNFEKKDDLGMEALAYARGEQFDLIFSVGSDSTDFVFKNFKGESIPVVSVTSKDPVLLGYLKDYETGSDTNFAFTSLNVPIELQMVYLQQLMPDLKNIAVMYAESNTSAKETQVEPLREIAKDLNINIIDVMAADKPLKDAKLSRDEFRAGVREQLHELMPAAIGQINASDPDHAKSIFWITGSTEVFDEIETITQLSDTVPVLSAVPDVVQEGANSAVLSIGVTFESNAHLAALYAADILLGEAQPGDLPVGVVSPPDIAINFMKAREIGLKIPFSFFESASIVYDYQGRLVRKEGQVVAAATGN